MHWTHLSIYLFPSLSPIPRSFFFTIVIPDWFPFAALGLVGMPSIVFFILLGAAFLYDHLHYIPILRVLEFRCLLFCKGFSCYSNLMFFCGRMGKKYLFFFLFLLIVFLLYYWMLDPFCNYSSSSTVHFLIISTLYTSKRCRFLSSSISTWACCIQNLWWLLPCPALHPFTQDAEARFIFCHAAVQWSKRVLVCLLKACTPVPQSKVPTSRQDDLGMAWKSLSSIWS